MIIRDPELLQSLTETTMNVFDNKISDIMAKNYVLQTGLPIYKEVNIEENNLFNAVLGFFENMSFQIGKIEKDVIWTSDNPVILYGETSPVKVHDLLLPLSPRLVLTMKPYEETEKGLYNRLLFLNDIEGVNKSILRHCKRWVYSIKPFTDEEIEWINKARS